MRLHRIDIPVDATLRMQARVRTAGAPPAPSRLQGTIRRLAPGYTHMEQQR